MRKSNGRFTFGIISLILAILASLIVVSFADLHQVFAVVQDNWSNSVYSNAGARLTIYDQSGRAVPLSKTTKLELNKTYKIVLDGSNGMYNNWGYDIGLFKRLQNSTTYTSSWYAMIKATGARFLNNEEVFTALPKDQGTTPYGTTSNYSVDYSGRDEFAMLNLEWNVTFTQKGRYYAGGYLVNHIGGESVLDQVGIQFLVVEDDSFGGGGSPVQPSKSESTKLLITDLSGKTVSPSDLKTNTYYRVRSSGTTNYVSDLQGVRFTLLDANKSSYYFRDTKKSFSTTSDQFGSMATPFNSNGISITGSHNSTSPFDFDYTIVFTSAGTYNILSEALYGYSSGNSFRQIAKAEQQLTVSASSSTTLKITDALGNEVDPNNIQTGLEYYIESTYGNAVNNLDASILQIDNNDSTNYLDLYYGLDASKSNKPSIYGKNIASMESKSFTLENRKIKVIFAEAGNYTLTSTGYYGVEGSLSFPNINYLTYDSKDEKILNIKVSGNSAYSGAVNYTITDLNGNKVDEKSLQTGIEYLLNIDIATVNGKLDASTFELSSDGFSVLTDYNVKSSNMESSLNGYTKYHSKGQLNLTTNTSTLSTYQYKILFKNPGTYTGKIQGCYGYSSLNGNSGFSQIVPKNMQLTVSGDKYTNIKYNILNSNGSEVAASSLKTGVEYTIRVDMGSVNNTRLDLSQVNIATPENGLVLSNVWTSDIPSIESLRGYTAGKKYANISSHKVTENGKIQEFKLMFLEPGNYKIDAEALFGYVSGTGSTAKYEVGDSDSKSIRVSGSTISGIAYTITDSNGNTVSKESLKTGTEYTIDITIMNQDNDLHYSGFYMSTSNTITEQNGIKTFGPCFLSTEQGVYGNGSAVKADHIDPSIAYSTISKPGINRFTVRTTFRTPGTYYGLMQAGYSRANGSFGRVSDEMPIFKVSDGGYQGVSYSITDTLGNVVPSSALKTGIDYTITVDALNNDGKLFLTSFKLNSGLQDKFIGQFTNNSNFETFSQSLDQNLVLKLSDNSKIDKLVYKVKFLKAATYSAESSASHGYINKTSCNYVDTSTDTLIVTGPDYSGISYTILDSNGNIASANRLSTNTEYTVRLNIDNSASNLDMQAFKIEDEYTRLNYYWGSNSSITDELPDNSIDDNVIYMSGNPVVNSSGFTIDYKLTFKTQGTFNAAVNAYYDITSITSTDSGYNIRSGRDSSLDFNITVVGEDYTGISYNITDESGQAVSPLQLQVGVKYKLDVSIDTSKTSDKLDVSVVQLLNSNSAIFSTGWKSNRVTDSSLSHIDVDHVASSFMYAKQLKKSSTQYTYELRFYTSGTFKGVFEANYGILNGNSFKSQDRLGDETFVVSGTDYNGISHTIRNSRGNLVADSQLRVGELYTLEVKIEDPDNTLDASFASILQHGTENSLLVSSYGNALISEISNLTATSYNRRYFVIDSIQSSKDGRLHTIKLKFNEPGTYDGRFEGFYEYNSGYGQSATYNRKMDERPQFIVTGEKQPGISYSITDLNGNPVSGNSLKTNTYYILTAEVTGDSTSDYPLDAFELVLQKGGSNVFLQRVGSSRVNNNEDYSSNELFIKQNVDRTINYQQYKIRFKQPNKYDLITSAYYGYMGYENTFGYKDEVKGKLEVYGDAYSGIDITVRDASGKVVSDPTRLVSGQKYSVVIDIADLENLDVSVMRVKGPDDVGNVASIQQLNYTSNFINNLGDNFSKSVISDKNNSNLNAKITNITSYLGQYSFDVVFSGDFEISIEQQAGYSAKGSQAQWINKGALLKATGVVTEGQSVDWSITLNGAKVDYQNLKTGVWYDLGIHFTNNDDKMNFSGFSFLSEDETMPLDHPSRWKRTFSVFKNRPGTPADFFNDSYVAEFAILAEAETLDPLDYKAKILFKEAAEYKLNIEAMYGAKNIVVTGDKTYSFSYGDGFYLIGKELKNGDGTTRPPDKATATMIKINGDNYSSSLAYELIDLNGNVIAYEDGELKTDNEQATNVADVVVGLPYTLNVHIRESTWENNKLSYSQIFSWNGLDVHNTGVGYPNPDTKNGLDSNSKNIKGQPNQLNWTTMLGDKKIADIKLVKSTPLEYSFELTFLDIFNEGAVSWPSPIQMRAYHGEMYVEAYTDINGNNQPHRWAYSNIEQTNLTVRPTLDKSDYVTEPLINRYYTGNNISVSYNKLRETMLEVGVIYSDISDYKNFGTLVSHDVIFDTLGEHRTGFSDVPNTSIQLTTGKKLITDDLIKKFLTFEADAKRYRYDIDSSSKFSLFYSDENKAGEWSDQSLGKSYGYINLINNKPAVDKLEIVSDDYNGTKLVNRYYKGVPFTIDVKISDSENDIWKYMLNMGEESIVASGYSSLISTWNIDGSGDNFTDNNFEVISMEKKDANTLQLKIMPKTSGNMAYSVSVDDAYTMQQMSVNTTVTNKLFINTDPTPPDAIITGPDRIPFNQYKTIKQASTDANDDIVSYKWELLGELEQSEIPPLDSIELDKISTIDNGIDGFSVNFPESAERHKFNVKLIVRDATGYEDTDVYTIEVVPPVPISNPEPDIEDNEGYIVRWEDGFGTLLAEKRIKSLNEGIPQYPNEAPTHPIYTFDGWGKQVQLGKIITIKALWRTAGDSDTSYLVKWMNGYNDIPIKTQTISASDPIPTYPTNPLRSGFCFWGWLDPIYNNDTHVIIITASWRDLDLSGDEHQVTWYDGFGSIILRVIVKDTDPIPTYPQNPTHNSCEFVGWSSSVVPDPNTNGSKDVAITALWNYLNPENGYYLVEWLNGYGGYVDRQIVREGLPIPDYPYTPVRDAYKFTGWTQPVKTQESYKDSNGNTVEYKKYTITAQWMNFDSSNTPDERYTIAWMNGYNDVPITTVKLSTLDPIPRYPSSPTRPGYTFIGWTSPEPPLNQVQSDDTVIIEALWEEVKAIPGYHLVTWYDSNDRNNLVVIDRKLVRNGASIPEYPDVPKYTDRALLCWEEPIKQANGDIDIHSKWRTIPPTDIFDKYDTYLVRWMSGYDPEYEIASKVVDKDQPIPKYPTPPTRPFYTFAGWTDPYEREEITDEGTELVIVIHAMWEEQQAPDGYYAVTWYDADTFESTIIDKQIVKEGDPIPTYPKAPTHGSYKFVGWTTPDETDARNIKIVAQYIRLRDITDPDGTYNVYWVMSRTDPTIISEALDRKNTDDIPRYPVSPVKTGFTFIGWESPEVSEDGKTVTIYAMWREDTNKSGLYSITWTDGYTNKQIDKKYAKIGDPIPEYPSAPDHTDQGYRFAGWKAPVKEENKDTGSINYSIVALYSNEQLPDSEYDHFIVRWFQDSDTDTPFHTHEIVGGTIENVQNNIPRYPVIELKPGYTFMGWDTPVIHLDDATRTYYIDISGIWEKANIVPDYYYVIWEDGFGNEIKKEKVSNKVNTLPTYPTSPEREGYRFNGWVTPTRVPNYVTEPNGVKVDAIRILASWINQSVPEGYHTVTWYDGWHTGESGIITMQIVKNGDPIPDYPIPNPVRDGYTFDGWGKPVEDGSKNISITARWVEKNTDIESGKHYVVWLLEKDSDTIIKKVEINNGDAIPEYPSQPIKSGLIFNGWDDPYMIEGDTTVYIPAIWADPLVGPGQLMVIWEDGFGNIVDRKVIKETDPIPPYPANPTHVTCTFDGWHEPVTLENKNILIVAKWILEEPDEGYHVVTWYAGYSKLPTAPTQYGDMIDRRFIKDGEPIPAYPNNPERDNFVFDGWGTPVKNDDGSIDIVANWKPYDQSEADGGTHDVVWISYGNKEVKRVTVDNGDPIPRYPSSPTRPGYVFAGWMLPELGEDGTTIYIRAIWDDILPVDGYYIVTWYTNYGDNTIIDRKLVKIGDPIPPYPVSPTRNGYDFNGWDLPVEDNETGNVTINALWKLDNAAEEDGGTHKVRWVRGPGNIGLLVELTVENGKPIPNYTSITPTRPGFIFFGWKAPRNLLPEEGDTSIILIEANWKELTAPEGYHVVKWIDGYTSEIIKADIVKDGDPVSEYPVVPNHEGKQFIGWSSPSIDSNGDIEIVANYTDKQNVWPENPNNYTEYTTIWYRYKGGDELAKVENIAIDDSIPAYPKNPTRQFYVFAGWGQPEYVEEDGKLYVIIYGLWNDEEATDGYYRVTWYDGYNNIIDRQFIKDGDPISSYPENPEPREDNKVFNGWASPVTDNNGNIDIVAKWRSTVPGDKDYDPDFDKYSYYQIIWDNGFDTILQETGIKEMKDFTFPRYPSSPSADNLVFAGWSDYIKEIRTETVDGTDKEVLTIIIHALWNKKSISEEDADKLYGVTWLDGFGNILKREIIAIGDPIPSYPNSPEHKDLKFKGWKKPTQVQDRPLEIEIEAEWRSTDPGNENYDKDIDKHDTYSVVWVTDKNMYPGDTRSVEDGGPVYLRVDNISKNDGIPKYLASPERENLIFIGWDNATKLWENEGTENENLVIVIGAIWKGTEIPDGKVSVTWWLYENGPIVDRKVITAGAEIPTYPKNPMNLPKLFIGWGQPQYSEDGNINIIAQWRDQDNGYGGEDGKYTVTWLQYEGGPVLKTEEYENTVGIGEYPDHGTRLGLQFNGWSDPHTDSEGNITIWGIWGPANIPDGYHSISWWDGIGTLENPRGTLIGFAVVADYEKIPDYPSVEARDEYTFAGWEAPVRDENANIHIIAKWKDKLDDTTEYTVQWYRYLGGDIVQEVVIPINADIPEYPAYNKIHRPGYIFDGWSTPEINTTNKTIVIVALWRDIVDMDGYYVVTWWDGFGAIIDRQLVKDNDPIPNYPASPKNDKYLFNGWSGAVYDESGNADITALWKNKDPYATGEYTVRWLKGYEDGKDPVIKSVIVPKGDADTGIPDYPASPTREGYIFIGWSNPSVLNANGDIDIIALWRIDQENYHTVTWYDGYTDIPIQISVVKNGMPIPKYPNNPLRKFYNFNGWGTPVYDKYGNIVISALWKPIQPGKGEHTVTWWDGYDGIIDRKIVKDGEPIPKYPSSPTYLGKIFAGWSAPSVDKDGNIDIFALWRDYDPDYGGNDGQYRVTWMDGYTNKPYQQITLNNDQGIPDYPDAPTRLGYTFIGWSTPEQDPDGEEGDLVITALWSNAGMDTSGLKNKIKVNRSLVVSGLNSSSGEGHEIKWSESSWTVKNLDTQDSFGVAGIANVAKDGEPDWSSVKIQFYQVGQYEVTLSLTNDWLEANPDSDYADLAKSSFIVNVIEDMDPFAMLYSTTKKPSYNNVTDAESLRNKTHTASFSVTGFSDDYDKVLEPSGYKWTFYEYTNGQVSTAREVPQNRIRISQNGRDAYVDVPYRFSGSTTIRAVVTVTETFGEDYVPEWLNEDYPWVRSTTVERSDTIRWKPIVTIGAPLDGKTPYDPEVDIDGDGKPDGAYIRAYPDDIIEGLNVIIASDSTEGQVNYIVNWQLSKMNKSGQFMTRNEYGVSWINSNKVSSTLGNRGGTINIAEPGIYMLKVSVKDPLGDSAEASILIRVYSMPIAVLTSNINKLPNSDKLWETKENILFQLNSYNTIVDDEWGKAWHQMDWSKDNWIVTGKYVSGSRAGKAIGSSEIYFMTVDNNSLYDSGANTTYEYKSGEGGSALAEAGNKNYFRSCSFTEPGEYTFLYQGTNAGGKKTQVLNQVITVNEDKAPNISAFVRDKHYRDQIIDDIATATISITGYGKWLNRENLLWINSPDGDNIDRVDVQITWDKDNNGSFSSSDEVWSMPGAKTDVNMTDFKSITSIAGNIIASYKHSKIN